MTIKHKGVSGSYYPNCNEKNSNPFSQRKWQLLYFPSPLVAAKDSKPYFLENNMQGKKKTLMIIGKGMGPPTLSRAYFSLIADFHSGHFND